MQNSRNTPAGLADTRMTRFLPATILLLVFSLLLGGSVAAQSIYEDYTWETLAGPDGPGPGAADAQGTNSRFAGPTGLARDTNGNFYLADSQNNTIRKIAPDG